MKYNKKTITAAAVAGVVALGGTTAVVAAHESTKIDNHPPIVKKLADEFKLDENKVHKVFLDNKRDRQGARQEKLNQRLDQAVREEKITEDQKTKLLTKLQELKAPFNSTKDDRKITMKDRRAELKKWADENGINLDELKVKQRNSYGPIHTNE